MGLILSLALHILGTFTAAVVIYFITPWFSRLVEAEVGFVYLVMYSLLAIWSVRTGRKIEKGKHNVANDIEKTFFPEERK